MARATTIDEYLTGVTPEQRAALEAVRRSILETAPGAKECISYGLPAFRLDGKVLVGFGATRSHCAFYPMSGSIIEAHADELQGFETSKGTIRFQPENPLPAALIRRLVEARIAENSG